MTSRVHKTNNASITAVLTMVMLACVSVSVAMAADDMPDMSIGAAQYPDQDAVILRWDQTWTIEKDGTVRRRDHKWFKYLSDRPIRAHADPRIDFVDGQDELIIHTARTFLPDGSVLPVPDYSFNRVGPDDVSRFPEYHRWQQMVVSFSGIMDHCVTELDYEIVTPPGTLPWIDGFVRLDDDYPVVEHRVIVQLPRGTTLHAQADDNVAWGDGAKTVAGDETRAGNGLAQHGWTVTQCPADHGEPKSYPWHQRSARVRFSTCSDLSTWVGALLTPVDTAATADAGIVAYCEKIVADETDVDRRIEAVAKKIRASFNLVDSHKALRGLPCRPAATVFQDNYGNSLEAGAILLAAYRSLGFTARPLVAVDATKWDKSDDLPPTMDAFAGVVVRLDTPDGLVYVHPRKGVLSNPGTWGRHWLLAAHDNGAVGSLYLSTRSEGDPSTLGISGKIKIDGKGQAEGDLLVRATGCFFDPEKLATSGAQASRVGNYIGRVASGVNVSSHAVTELGTQRLVATAHVKSDGPLEGAHGQYLMELGSGPAFLPDVPMPLDRSTRRTDVVLAGKFNEYVDLTVELPKGWSASVVPVSLSEAKRGWGNVHQSVEVDGQTVRLRRSVAVGKDVLTPTEFLEVRRAVNDLRATHALLLVVGAGE